MKKAFSKIKELIRTRTGMAILAVLVVFLIIDIVVLVNLNKGDTLPSLNHIRSVELISVEEINNKENILSIIGTVRSENEAVLNTESSGRVIRVYKNVGKFVNAGTIIAEIENSSERASVLQAQGMVEQAEANLERIKDFIRWKVFGFSGRIDAVRFRIKIRCV